MEFFLEGESSALKLKFFLKKMKSVFVKGIYLKSPALKPDWIAEIKMLSTKNANTDL